MVRGLFRKKKNDHKLPLERCSSPARSNKTGPLPLQTRPVPSARKSEQNKMQGPQRQGYNQVMEIHRDQSPGRVSKQGVKADWEGWNY